MPRGAEPSWIMKTHIWDLASKQGVKPEVITRDLDRLSDEGGPLEGHPIPDSRTVKRVIDGIQALDIEILATLPRHLWTLRQDYIKIKEKLEKTITGDDKEAIESRLRREQMQHIANLQDFSRSIIELWPSLDKMPFTGVSHENAIPEYTHSSLNALFRRLVKDARWPSLSIHLGDKAKEIIYLAGKLDSLRVSLKQENSLFPTQEINKLNKDAYKVLNNSLAVVASSGDMDEWKRYGLQPICPYCPILMPI